MKQLLSIAYCLLSASIVFAQTANSIEMADQLRSSGKIYVVVGVLTTILVGLIIFLIMIDRKVSDIEKKINK
ncbi:MAG: CcmD family protein [Bacteroidetes bacterium]|nr:CcmD family protein [Bacteroidota bacterium]